MWQAIQTLLVVSAGLHRFGQPVEFVDNVYTAQWAACGIQWLDTCDTPRLRIIGNEWNRIQNDELVIRTWNGRRIAASVRHKVFREIGQKVLPKSLACRR